MHLSLQQHSVTLAQHHNCLSWPVRLEAYCSLHPKPEVPLLTRQRCYTAGLAQEGAQFICLNCFSLSVLQICVHAVFDVFVVFVINETSQALMAHTDCY